MLSAKKELFTPSGGAYQISRSVRTRASASAYLNRTFASTGNAKTWTWSGWIKRGTLGTKQNLFGHINLSVANRQCYVSFETDNTLSFRNFTVSGYDYQLFTTQVFRDSSAWYHIIIVSDTTQATAANRLKIYVNGVQVTAFGTATYPSQNFDGWINANAGSGVQLGISRAAPYDTTEYFDGYQTEINFIDGQALTPSSFGETNPITGVWQPKRYTGTYGTNGFYLNFSDNSAATAAAIGKDYSGNGNNWTPNNISVTAGVTYDSMIDVPTPYDDGNTGRGNYATFNPLAKGPQFSAPAEGNLRVGGTTVGNYHQTIGSTIAVNTGKWYWEIPVNGATFNSRSLGIAFASQLATASDNAMWNAATALKDYRALFFVNSTTMTPCRSIAGTVTTATNITLPSTPTGSSIFMIAMDINVGAIWFGLDGTWLKGATTAEIIAGTTTNAVYADIGSPSDSWTPAVYSYLGAAGYGWFANFGQRPFSYTPPTGFKALNTQNLPDATIKNGAAYMAATLYAGSSSAQSITNTVNGVSFQPDLVWGKNRSNVNSHRLTDVNRGVGKVLFSDLTAGDTTGDGQLSSFNSNGWTFTSGVGAGLNESGNNYVAWNWKAGGTPVTNTSGSISAQVSANPTAGFSVVTYTGNGTSGSTIGHGLGVAPKLILIKRRQGTNNWAVAGSILGSASTLYLNLTNAMETYTVALIGNIQTSTTFQVGNDGNRNESGGTFVAYCFAPVAGYSAFGSYTGNGSADGPFVYLGFRPRWLMIKNITNAQPWIIVDTSRNTYNQAGDYLQTNSSAAENGGSAVSTATADDILSNGFKLRNNASSSGYTNGSGNTYIYAAFAENPFKNSLAR